MENISNAAVNTHFETI